MLTIANVSTNVTVTCFMTGGRGVYIPMGREITLDYRNPSTGAREWGSMVFQKVDGTAMGTVLCDLTFDPLTLTGTQYRIRVHNTYAEVDTRNMTPVESFQAGFLWCVPFAAFALFYAIFKTTV